MTTLLKILKKFTTGSKESTYLKKRDIRELVRFGGRIPRVVGFVAGNVARIQGKRTA
jgi:hypothetical protein